VSLSDPAQSHPASLLTSPSEPPPDPSIAWRKNAVLFALTVFTVLLQGSFIRPQPEGQWSLLAGWTFALPLMLILLFHEFGHWFAARIHRVPASLPYFIPLPPIFLLGTMGAIIVMPQRIRSRNALLDIGAAGPLAGLVVAIPALIIGLSLSEVHPMEASGYMQEGQSLLYWCLKRLVLGPIPPGHDVFLHETALAGWAGLLVTMMNLLPWGQLDGGHVAYALLGERHHAIAVWVRRSLLLVFGYNLVQFLGPVLRGETEMSYGFAFGNSGFWLMWFIVTGFLARMSGGHRHPPFEPGVLSSARRWVAIVTLLFFVLLFMPTPIATY
jgi:membrane-associated protease RseP (regulator of RpoE activity)